MMTNVALALFRESVSRTKSSYVIAEVDKLYGLGLRTRRFTRMRPPNGVMPSSAIPRNATVGAVKRCLAAALHPSAGSANRRILVRRRMVKNLESAHWQRAGPGGIIPRHPTRDLGTLVNMLRSYLAALVAILAATGAAAQQHRADLVLLHGDLFTVDSQHPRAHAIAVRGDRIAAVGSDSEIQRWVGSRTRVVDLRGRLAIPGF